VRALQGPPCSKKSMRGSGQVARHPWIAESRTQIQVTSKLAFSGSTVPLERERLPLHIKLPNIAVAENVAFSEPVFSARGMMQVAAIFGLYLQRLPISFPFSIRSLLQRFPSTQSSAGYRICQCAIPIGGAHREPSSHRQRLIHPLCRCFGCLG
jgi:hypothetical protein